MLLLRLLGRGFKDDFVIPIPCFWNRMGALYILGCVLLEFGVGDWVVDRC